MICKICGRNIENDNANFCEYCGTSLRDSYDGGPQLTEFTVSENKAETANQGENKKGDISFKQWLGTMAVPFIPFIGFPVFVVLLFLKAFGAEHSKTMKNWAKATLIIGIFVFLIFSAMVANISQMIASGADLTEILNSYYLF